MVRLVEPSITRAMNRGLWEASQTSVLFVDDEIIPESDFLEMHWRALERTGAALIAGRVIQPWHEGFHFASMQAGWYAETSTARLSMLVQVLQIARFLYNHPLTRDHGAAAFARFCRWQIESRLRHEVVVPWVGGNRLAARRGMKGATGKILSFRTV